MNMTVDWQLILEISAPIVTLIIGILLNRYFENRERLLVYQGNIASHVVKAHQQGQADIHINTHSLIVSNTGNKAASNVRVGHAVLPSFKIYPDTDHSVVNLPGGSSEIVFPKIVPKKEITISYLYYPPTTFNQINTHVESDEGPAKVVNVKVQRVTPAWLNRSLLALLVIGAVATIYLLIQLALWVYA